MKPLATLLVGAMILPLGACGRQADTPRHETAASVPVNDAGAAMPDSVTNAATPAPVKAAMPAGILSCAAERGQTAADRLAKICTSVSPATHPPCHAANSCAIIEDEIARSCALIGDDAGTTPGCTVDPKSDVAAAAVVRRYYSAINAHDYTTAWTQWGPDGRPGQRFADFEKGFTDTRATRVTIGPVPPSEGAAGSIYATIPVTVDAQRNDGRQQRFTGQYVVRRVSGVDGASAEQRRWHIDSATLKSVR